MDQVLRHRVESALRNLCARRIIKKYEWAGRGQGRKLFSQRFDGKGQLLRRGTRGFVQI
jgi:hypothetical protein